jgi:hypothetical protein
VTSQEKSTWVMLVLVTLVYGIYLVVVMGDVAAVPEVRDIAYRGMTLATWPISSGDSSDGHRHRAGPLFAVSGDCLQDRPGLRTLRGRRVRSSPD